MGKYVIESKFENTRCFLEVACENREPYFFINRVDSLTPYTEPDLEQVRKKAYQSGYETAKHEYEDCTKPLDNGKAYQQGLTDAWEAARTLWNTPNRKAIFGYTTFSVTLTTLTAQEAIEKIRQYKQEKEEQIQVGDEVERILNGEVDSKAVFLEDNEGYYHCLFWTGCCFTTLSYPKEQFRKTGRHFDEIATVLEKMKES